MKPFNLEEYLANPARKMVTRNGLNARIICTDRKDLNYPIIALIETKSGGEYLQYYTKDGKYYITDLCDEDLLFAPEKKEGWVNVYKTNCMGTEVFNTPDSAKEYGMRHVNYVATIKIEWEE